MSANVETMFYAGREVPWHGLGTQVDEAPTSAEALRLAGLDWTVERKRSWSVRHTGDIKMKLQEARMCLDMANKYMDKLAVYADRMANKTVTDEEIAKILDEMFPVDDDMSDREKRNAEKARDDYQLLSATMNSLLRNITEEIVVVCGQAKGADTLGEQYAKEHGYRVDYYPANWKLYGKRAGYLRNEQMAQNADALAAFWNGESRGTKHMIDLAKRYGLKVRIKKYGRGG